jgi:fructoselysine-6-P-deglycase FrlB-like protein
MVSSLYEANILNQPAEWKRLLSIPLPRDLNTIRPKKIVFIGIGSSYWVARFAEFLWREHQTILSILNLYQYKALTLLNRNTLFQITRL